jgi:hypothetical protein
MPQFFKFTQWLILGFHSDPSLLHCVDVAYVADISEIHVAFIFMIKLCVSVHVYRGFGPKGTVERKLLSKWPFLGSQGK